MIKETIKPWLITICVVALCLILPYSSLAQEWEQIAGDHFIVYYIDDEQFAKDVSNKAEVHYRRIATELGYPRYSEFWTWDNRVKIYINKDKASYLKATGMPEWSSGMADYGDKEIVSFRWSEHFTDSLLPHEMAHLIFRDFVGFTGEIPLWLDEGVAQWAEKVKRPYTKAMANNYYEEDKLLLMEDIMKLNMKVFAKIERVYIRPTRTRSGVDGVLFLSTDQLISTFYLQSVSVIGFLLERYGSIKFAHFCRQLRDGDSVEDALRSAYPDNIQDIQDLDDEWREYLEKNLQAAG